MPAGVIQRQHHPHPRQDETAFREGGEVRAGQAGGAPRCGDRQAERTVGLRHLPERCGHENGEQQQQARDALLDPDLQVLVVRIGYVHGLPALLVLDQLVIGGLEAAGAVTA